MQNIIYIDPIYIEYRRMWNEDRWKFSATMVNLNIKKSYGIITDEELAKLTTLERIVEENGNRWTEEPRIRKKR